MRLWIGALFAVVLVLPRVVSAQAAVSVGPRLDFYRPNDADHGDWAPGVQVNIPTDALYSVEASMDWARYVSRGTTVRTTPIQATLRGYFSSPSAFEPYMLIGGGWYPTHADGPYKSGRLFGPHVGAGASLALGRNLSIDGSYRFLWTQIVTLSRPYGADYASRGHMFTAAVNYQF